MALFSEELDALPEVLRLGLSFYQSLSFSSDSRRRRPSRCSARSWTRCRGCCAWAAPPRRTIHLNIAASVLTKASLGLA